MIKYECECVGCTTMGLPCKGDSCPNRSVAHFICDHCGWEADLYEFEGEQLCIDCIKKLLTPVTD